MSTESDLAARVRDVLDVDAEEFAARAEADAEVVKEALRDGAFDNHQSIVGFEYEFYAVADGRWSEESRAEDYALMRVPRRLLEHMGFEKELGLHNAEMRTSPQPLSEHGLQAQESEIRARLEAALDTAAAEGMRLVSDGVWTIPPVGENAREYLTDSVEIDGIRVATNMSDAARYHAMANFGAVDVGSDGAGGSDGTNDERSDGTNDERSDGTNDEGSDADGPEKPATTTLQAPGVSLEADTVMPESLITSIQPHYQVAQAATLPVHFNYALRVAGPLLALGVNSPFFPPELYDDDWDGERVLAEGAQENRIHVFESVLNSRTDEDKVRFPGDLETAEEAVDRVATDETLVPLPVDGSGDRFDDDFATFRMKHGTYWRWVRPVFEGASRSAANARIEFRPVPGQPTVRDSVAFQAAFAGLMEALPRHEHPVIDLSHDRAIGNFYAAVADGLEADLTWIGTDGTLTTECDEIYEELLDYAGAGLESAGCTTAEAERWLAPLRWRVEEATTPASWKRDRVRERLDEGATFADAVADMQREYVGNQTETLINGSLAGW